MANDERHKLTSHSHSYLTKVSFLMRKIWKQGWINGLFVWSESSALYGISWVSFWIRVREFEFNNLFLSAGMCYKSKTCFLFSHSSMLSPCRSLINEMDKLHFFSSSFNHFLSSFTQRASHESLIYSNTWKYDKIIWKFIALFYTLTLIVFCPLFYCWVETRSFVRRHSLLLRYTSLDCFPKKV